MGLEQIWSDVGETKKKYMYCSKFTPKMVKAKLDQFCNFRVTLE